MVSFGKAIEGRDAREQRYQRELRNLKREYSDTKDEYYDAKREVKRAEEKLDREREKDDESSRYRAIARKLNGLEYTMNEKKNDLREMRSRAAKLAGWLESHGYEVDVELRR